MLVTKLMLGHQPLHIVVKLHNTAIVLDPEDGAMCLQARFGIFIAGNDRQFGCDQSFLQSQYQLLSFRVTK